MVIFMLRVKVRVRVYFFLGFRVWASVVEV